LILGNNVTLFLCNKSITIITPINIKTPITATIATMVDKLVELSLIERAVDEYV